MAIPGDGAWLVQDDGEVLRVSYGPWNETWIEKDDEVTPAEIRALAARLGEIADRLERAEAGHE